VFVDTLVYRPSDLAHIVRELGPSQLVLGTDYPFDMGQEQPLSVVDAVSELSDADRIAIKSGNAASLLGL
jgi:aminocarboxymuconate-semialdehyde decarboxylase